MARESLFAEYLQMLPSDFTSFPVNYPEGLKKELKGTCFLEQIENKLSDMQKDY